MAHPPQKYPNARLDRISGEIFSYCRENRHSLDSERHTKEVLKLLLEAVKDLKEKIDARDKRFADLSVKFTEQYRLRAAYYNATKAIGAVDDTTPRIKRLLKKLEREVKKLQKRYRIKGGTPKRRGYAPSPDDIAATAVEISDNAEDQIDHDDIRLADFDD